MKDSFSLQHHKPGAHRPGDVDEQSGDAEWDLAAASEGQNATQDPGASGAGPSPSPPYDATNPMANSLALSDLSDNLDDDDGPDLMGSLDLLGLIRGVWRRRFLVIAVAAVIAGLFLFLALRIEHSWTAISVLIKRDNAEQFSLGDGSSYQPKAYTVKTLLDTLKLRSSLDEVMTRSEVTGNRYSFAGAIGVNIGKDSDILRISTTWKDPLNAALITNHMTDVFLEKTITIQRREAKDAFNYYNAQLTAAREQRREIDAQLLTFQSENNVTDYDAEISARITAVAELQDRFLAKQAHLGALTTIIAELEQEIGAQPETVITSTIYRSPLKQRMTIYKWELREAHSRYTPDNPKVQKLQQKINTLQRLIDDSKDEGAPENTYAPNSNVQSLKLVKKERESELTITRADTGAIRRMIETNQRKLESLKASEKQYLSVKSRQNTALLLENSLRQRIEEARLQMLRNEPAFDILERAQPPIQPNPSGRKVIAAAGVVLGGGFGLLLALALELLDPFIRTLGAARRIAGTDLCIECAVRDPNTSDAAQEQRIQQFRRFSNDLEASKNAAELQSIAIISADAGPQQAQVAVDLAHAFASKERRTVLIDGDFSSADARAKTSENNTASTDADGSGTRPSLLTSGHQSPGLIDVLQGHCKLSAALQESPLAGLQYLVSGKDIDQQQGNIALGSRRLRSLVHRLQQLQTQIIYLLPPLSDNEAALEAAAAIGSVILVMRSGHSRRQRVNRLVDQLEFRGVRVIAALVVDVPEQYLEQRPDNDQPKHLLQKLRKKVGHGH